MSIALPNCHLASALWASRTCWLTVSDGAALAGAACNRAATLAKLAPRQRAIEVFRVSMLCSNMHGTGNHQPAMLQQILAARANEINFSLTLMPRAAVGRAPGVSAGRSSTPTRSHHGR